MSTTAKETVKVDELTKYGVKVGSVYYNWSKNCKDQAKVVPGATLTMTVYTADSGKKYINDVVGEAAAVPVKKETPVVKSEAPKAPVLPSKTEAMSKDEWAAKDRRISRQGCIQVAVQVCCDFDKAAELADKMLGYVNG